MFGRLAVTARINWMSMFLYSFWTSYCDDFFSVFRRLCERSLLGGSWSVRTACSRDHDPQSRMGAHPMDKAQCRSVYRAVHDDLPRSRLLLEWNRNISDDIEHRCLIHCLWSKVKSRRNMKALQILVAKEAKDIEIEFMRARIAALPKILPTIEANKGGRTKYWVSVLLCAFLKLFLRRQVFQDCCYVRLTSVRTAIF